MDNTVTVNEARARFENNPKQDNSVELKPIVRGGEGQSNKKEKKNGKLEEAKWKTKFKRVLKTSRFAGLPLAILYGVYVYYLFAFFLLSDPPTLPANEFYGDSANFSGESSGIEFECQFKFQAKNENDTNTNTTEDHLMDQQMMNTIIAASTGGTVTLTLGIGSIFSRHTRCSMMLIVPSLFAGRGRAFILTAGMGFLIDGPLNSINFNVEQIVHSLTCMYSQMKTMACRFKTNFKNIFGQVAKILKTIHADLKARLKKISQDVETLTGEAKAKAEAAKIELEAQINQFKEQIGPIKAAIETPGNILNGVCNGVGSALSDAGDWFSGAASDIGDFFGRRRKRSGCGIPSIIPDLNLNLPGVDLEALREFARKLKPQWDGLNLDLLDFSNVFQAQSISAIRLNIINILKGVFQLVHKYFYYVKKLFYLASLLMVTIDAYSYMKNYHSDDSFDNMYVDSNLKKMWTKNDKPKLTPLRQWELNEKYQVSMAAKLSAKELKRIVWLTVPTLLFATIAICVLVADTSLASLLDVLKENGEYGITFQGMEQGLNLGDLLSDVKDGKIPLVSLKIEAFDLSTEPCLPRPIKTEKRKLAWLIVIVVGCLISCLVDAYASRWRSQICNIFFESRAVERGQYLHKRITAGRGNRRFQLRLVAIREKLRRQRLLEFSIWNRFTNWLSNKCCNASSSAVCHACDWKVSKECTKELTYTENGKDVLTTICDDCNKDQ